ncbi:MAG: HD domain-containing protein [Candidatus Altiarchaeum hamiconexum]|uniref:HD domain-containing protein n=1 Tax=Candidatus Altarchaeum hamiconexum TaxID=1803513 RepID=A0A8J7Z1I6_9ARCH|nr:HD domain-containing protein [Candidatus Altarchaeum hamiconexum]OIQ06141.1 MAG: hypothetical protein AUK59_00940 [Candidatus Altarchaeum sp. CG2_30_32_3053]PIN66840.1 MAG: hypothetical protein COV98_06080 [Candidatus Altarchaeum sp. CG12_big_fil_rev_8_21_14_0_65_33_22]PIV28903.1 MAG: hypothetical protein COS36_00570 [Candidatus Altarchaeum sp. CG03_land_8_20_14_0_80_32_618]PIZ29376.1 MAG: hypothetical protein COY41_05665 [Candidatus Altarchaeum sp. CG_4_10_14_0_8_um_filter_32_851]PJC14980.
MEKIFVNDLKKSKDKKIDSFFAVVEKKEPQLYKNKPGYYFRVVVKDKTGITIVYFWGKGTKEEVDKVFMSFNEGNVIFVSGVPNIYNDELQISVDPLNGGIIRKAVENEYNAGDFLPFTNQNIEEMEKYLRATINEIEDKFLKKLLLKFFSDENFTKKFKKYPAAVMYHHACVGGLMEHTVEVVKLCKAISEIHTTGMNKDLTIAGAILHDIGKLETITVNDISYSNDNEEDVLRDHMSIAEEMIIKNIYEIDEEAKSGEDKFPEILKHELLHIIFSHHGKKEQGSVVNPAIPEAAAVYAADYFSSSVTQYIRAIKDDKGNSKTKRVNPIGRVYIDPEKKKKETEIFKE